MCISCHEREPIEHHELCPHCFVEFRIEVVTGTRRLDDYLAGWAAFQSWCSERELAAAA